MDQRLEAAARTLGSNAADVFFTITLPLILPGIIAGAILGFARSLGEFGLPSPSSPTSQAKPVRPIALYNLTQVPGQEDAAFRLVVISVVVALLALAASEFLARRARARVEGRR